MASPKGKVEAEKFLDQMFSASELVEQISGPSVNIQKIRAVAAKHGYKFTAQDLRDAIKAKVQSQSVPILRFCFSESPSA